MSLPVGLEIDELAGDLRSLTPRSPPPSLSSTPQSSPRSSSSSPSSSSSSSSSSSPRPQRELSTVPWLKGQVLPSNYEEIDILKYQLPEQHVYDPIMHKYYVPKCTKLEAFTSSSATTPAQQTAARVPPLVKLKIQTPEEKGAKSKEVPQPTAVQKVVAGIKPPPLEETLKRVSFPGLPQGHRKIDTTFQKIPEGALYNKKYDFYYVPIANRNMKGGEFDYNYYQNLTGLKDENNMWKDEWYETHPELVQFDPKKG